MNSKLFIFLTLAALFVAGVIAGQHTQNKWDKNQIDSLKKEISILKDEIEIKDANYQNLLYEIFIKYPVFTQDTLMEDESWEILREYNGDFHILFKNISIGEYDYLYYKSDADRQEGADL